jgi:hypothetical protein
MITCNDCGGDYGPPFIWMSDEQWRQLGCLPGHFLCYKCIAERVNKSGIWVWYLVADHGEHKLDACKTNIKVSYQKSHASKLPNNRRKISGKAQF